MKGHLQVATVPTAPHVQGTRHTASIFIVYLILLAFDTPVTECPQAEPAFVLPAASFQLLSLLFSLMLFSTQHSTHVQTFSGVILQAAQDGFDAQMCSDRCWDFSPSPLHLRLGLCQHVFLSRRLTNGILMWGTCSFLIVFKPGSSEAAAVCAGCNLCPCLLLPMWNLTLLLFNHRRPD